MVDKINYAIEILYTFSCVCFCIVLVDSECISVDVFWHNSNINKHRRSGFGIEWIIWKVVLSVTL